jgi:hypothetical protein
MAVREKVVRTQKGIFHGDVAELKGSSFYKNR